MSWSNFLRKLKDESNVSDDIIPSCEFEHFDISNKEEKLKGMSFIPTLQLYTDKYENDEMSKKSDNNTSDEINEIVDEAHLIIEDANKKAAQIKNEAQGIVNKIKQESHEKGFNEGFEEGKKQGIKDIQNKEERLIKLINELGIIREDIVQKSQDQIMTFIILLTEKIIQKEISSDRSIILKNLDKVLRMILKDDKIQIRLHPDDLSYINSIDSKNTDSVLFKKKKNVQFISDSSISTGGCIARTDFGIIDASIEAQLDEIKKVITDVP